eukprot:COSAG05_NODE_28_length_29121_cov_56.951933_13_plen_237_part_00
MWCAQEHAQELGLGAAPRVLSTAEQTLFVSQALHNFPLRHYAAATGLQLNHATRASAGTPPQPGNATTRRFVHDLLRWIGRLQERGVESTVYAKWVRRWGRQLQQRRQLQQQQQQQQQQGRADDSWRAAVVEWDRWERASELAACYTQYDALKRAHCLVDMGDFALQLLRLLVCHPASAQALAARYDHFLVDEFQDLSPVQLAVIKRLCRTATTHPRTPTLLSVLKHSLLAVVVCC